MPFKFPEYPENDIEKLNFIDSVFKIDSIKIKKYMSNAPNISKDLNTLIEVSHSLFNYRDSITELLLTTNYKNKILVVKIKTTSSITLKKFIGIKFFVEFVNEN